MLSLQSLNKIFFMVYISQICFSFYFKIYVFYLNVEVHRESERWRDLPSAVSPLKWSLWLELCQFEAVSQEFLSCLPGECRAPKSWATNHCFPRPLTSGWPARIQTGAYISLLCNHAELHIPHISCFGYLLANFRAHMFSKIQYSVYYLP